MTSTTTELHYLPTKKEILERLLAAGHITFNEMWVLIEDEPDVKYVVVPDPIRPYIPPIDYTQPPWTPPEPVWVGGTPNPTDVEYKPPTF